jgi:hypothetical protein
LPVQIPISVALDWLNGRDSTAANQDRDQNRIAASYYLSWRNWSTEMIQARK